MPLNGWQLVLKTRVARKVRGSIPPPSSITEVVMTMHKHLFKLVEMKTQPPYFKAKCRCGKFIKTSKGLLQLLEQTPNRRYKASK